jgi:hypothetical protein
VTNHLKHLEELIAGAVDRLGSLTTERDGLRRQVDSLQESLEARKHEASRGDRGSDAAGAWQAREAQALRLVREALSELRGG